MFRYQPTWQVGIAWRPTKSGTIQDCDLSLLLCKCANKIQWASFARVNLTLEPKTLPSSWKKTGVPEHAWQWEIFQSVLQESGLTSKSTHDWTSHNLGNLVPFHNSTVFQMKTVNTSWLFTPVFNAQNVEDEGGDGSSHEAPSTTLEGGEGEHAVILLLQIKSKDVPVVNVPISILVSLFHFHNWTDEFQSIITLGTLYINHSSFVH